MIYPIKTLSQLPLILKGFRKEKKLTQAAIAERLGITQQSYAYFEANPATATLERLFVVLRMLNVEISLDQAPPATVEENRQGLRLLSRRAVSLSQQERKKVGNHGSPRKDNKAEHLDERHPCRLLGNYSTRRTPCLLQ